MGWERVEHGVYARDEYVQFTPSGAVAAAWTIARVLAWPIAVPLALISRLSDMVFRTVSELLAQAPYVFGVVLRGEFYRFALASCGTNVVVEFGTVFLYRDVRLGSNVLLGRYNIVHHCDFGDYVLTAERCSFLSGSRYHDFTRTDTPIALQGGWKKRIRVEDDCWIGAHAVVMEDVRTGAVVGAGSVVTEPVPERAIVAGIPAKVIRTRGEGQAADAAAGGRG